MPAFSDQPTAPPQPPLNDTTDPDRMIEAARARREKALFDDDLDWAELQCREALKLYRDSGHQVGVAQALDELGLIALKRGRAGEALGLLEQAAAAARAANDPVSQAQATEHRAKAYAAAKQLQQAIEADRQAFALFRGVKQREGEFSTLIHLARVSTRLGQTGQALQYGRRALIVARRAGDWRYVAGALDQLMMTYQRGGESQRAMRFGAQALAAHRQANDQLGEATVLARLGEVSRQMGHSQQAADFYQQAVRLAHEVHAAALEWRLHARLARAYQEQGRPDQARSSFEAAVNIIASTPAELMRKSLGQPISIEPREVFREYVDFLLRSDVTPARLARAWTLSEQAHGRAVLDLLARGHIRIHSRVDLLFLERERHLLQEWHDLQLALQAPGLSRAERQPLLQQLSQAEAEVENFKRDIRRVQPRYAALRYPRVSTVEHIQQQALAADAALLEYLLGKERSYLFVIAPDTPLAAYLLPAKERVERAVKIYRRFLTQPPTGREAAAAGQQLYDMLIEPASELLRDKTHLIIVPDGWLHYLPFAALVRGGQRTTDNGQRTEKNWRTLLEDDTIAYVPSASLLDWLRQQPAGPAGERPLLVCGDQGSSQASLREQSAAPAPPADSERETHAIARALGELYTDVWLEGSTGEMRLKRTELNRYRLLHLAVEGIIDEDEPWRSGLDLALESEADEASEGGFLPLSAIFNLEWQAQLVTLSHTRPRLAEPVTGTALMGLAASVFYSGPPALVVSVWDIKGPSTGEFMKAFYLALRQGHSAEAALRAAKLKLRQQEQYQSPAYWARFVLIGDGETTIQLPSIGQTVVVSSAALVAILLLALGVFLRKSRPRS